MSENLDARLPVEPHTVPCIDVLTEPARIPRQFVSDEVGLYGLQTYWKKLREQRSIESHRTGQGSLEDWQVWK